MIEYDYEIIRKSYKPGRNELRFVPDKIPTKLPGIVHIIGENSCGKSSLLHIIAFGFYGLKNDSIDEVLKRKMKNLIRDDQNLTFKICISSKDNKIKLITEKKDLDSNNFEIYELRNNSNEKKYLNPQTFKERYKLIYDIPFDPTERLQSLIKEIEQDQNDLSSKISKLRTEVNEIIREIKNCNPLKKVEAEKAYTDLLSQQESLKVLLPGLKKDLNFLEKTVYYNLFNKYKKENQKIKKEVDASSKSIATKDYKIVEGMDLLSASIQTARLKILNLRDLRNDSLITFKLLMNKMKKNEKYLIQLWDELDFLSVIEQREFPDDFKLCIEELEKIFNRIEKENTEKDTYKVLKLYQDLVDILEKNKNLDVQLPKLDTSIAGFITELNKLISQKRDLLNLIENIKEAKQKLKSIKDEKVKIEKDYLNKIDEIQVEIKELDEKKKEEMQELIHSEELKIKKAEAKQIDKIFGNYEKKYREIGSPKRSEIGLIGQGKLKDFGSYSEKQLIDYIAETYKLINDKEKNLTEIEIHIDLRKKEIEKLSEIKPHKYQEYEEKLNLLLQILNTLQKKFDNQFIPFLKIIKNKSTTKLEKNQELYNLAVSEYFGNLIGRLYHIDQYYDVESIDFLKDIVITKSGEKIRLSDMGTGQSQSAYLQSLLRDPKESKIIALFDETSHLDDNSLKPIILRLKNLYTEGKLILAILVKMKKKGIEIINLCDDT